MANYAARFQKKDIGIVPRQHQWHRFDVVI